MTKKKPQSPLKNWAVFVGLAFQMGITIAAGAFFGVWLDGKVENAYSAFTIIFSLLGVFVALYAVIKQVNALNEDE